MKALKGFSLKEEAKSFLKDLLGLLIPKNAYKLARDFALSVIVHDVRKAAYQRMRAFFEGRKDKARIKAIKAIDRLIAVNRKLGYEPTQFKTLAEAMNAGMDELQGVRTA